MASSTYLAPTCSDLSRMSRQFCKGSPVANKHECWQLLTLMLISPALAPTDLMGFISRPPMKWSSCRRCSRKLRRAKRVAKEGFS